MDGKDGKDQTRNTKKKDISGQARKEGEGEEDGRKRGEESHDQDQDRYQGPYCV
jgi:hypothetical protein